MTNPVANKPILGFGGGTSGGGQGAVYDFMTRGDNTVLGSPPRPGPYSSGTANTPAEMRAAGSQTYARVAPLAPSGNGDGPADDKKKKRRRRRRRGGGGGGGGSQSAAVRDVNLALNAQIDAINREQQQAYYDYQNRVNGANAAYGGFNNIVGGMSAPYEQQTQANQQAYNSAIQPYQSSQGNVLGLDPNEYMAGQGLFNTGATATQGMLSSMGQRGLDYLSGAQTEGALAQRYAQDNLLQGWEDSQNQFAQRRLDATDHSGDMILQRLDYLKQQALQNRGLRQQYRSNDAYNEMMRQLIQSLL